MAKVTWYGQHFVADLVKYCLLLEPKDYLRECKRLHIEEPRPFLIPGSGATTHFLDGDDGKSVCLVTVDLSEKRTIRELDAIIIHESVHVYQEMMRSMREDNPGKEMEAYYIQRIGLDLLCELDHYFKENPHAHPDYREPRKSRRNVVRRRGRSNAKGS